MTQLLSFREQTLTLIARHGIESITAPAGVLAAQPLPDATVCPQCAPVTLRLKLGRHKPSDWILNVASR